VALSPGARLGPYEVVSALGAGGMGEVYKARVTSLQWRDHDGATTGSAIAPAVYRSPRLSSDQTRALVTKWDPETGQSDIWMLRLALGNEQRQTFDLLNGWFPVWSPDDSQIFFGSSRNGAATKIFRRAEQDEPITGLKATIVSRSTPTTRRATASSSATLSHRRAATMSASPRSPGKRRRSRS
jgi:hypothetical protein